MKPDKMYKTPQYKGILQKKAVSNQLLNIEAEYARRKGGAFTRSDFEMTPTKAESARFFLLREIYILGLHMIENQPDWSPRDLISSVRKEEFSSPNFVGGSFHTLLMAMTEKGDKEALINRQERNAMVRELKYAQVHSVPPQFLCGFLLQSGGRKKLRLKLTEDYIEPAFRAHEEEEEEDMD